MSFLVYPQGNKPVGFLHIPRTGGTWIHNATWGVFRPRRWTQSYAHKRMWLPVEHLMPAHFVNPYRLHWCFAFVRHPVPYYESVWKWIHEHQQKPIRFRWTWHPFIEAVRAYNRWKDFNDWVACMLDTQPCWYSRMVEGYVGPDGGEWVDYIGRTITLTEDWVDVMEVLGVDRGKALAVARSTPRANVIVHRLRWHSVLQQRVLETERLVLQRFYGPRFGRRLYAQLAQAKVAGMVAGRRDYNHEAQRLRLQGWWST